VGRIVQFVKTTIWFINLLEFNFDSSGISSFSKIIDKPTLLLWQAFHVQASVRIVIFFKNSQTPTIAALKLFY